MDENKMNPKMILVPISLGELLDKISILQVKLKKIEESKLQPVKFELNALKSVLENLIEEWGIVKSELDKLIERIFEINYNQWNMEDRIRKLRLDHNYTQEYIDISESISKSNKKRIEIKNEINHKFGSNIEVKSYFGE